MDPPSHPSSAAKVANKKTFRRPRGPGRPEAGSADLREKLLNAALVCFLRESVAATSLRAIANEAGVTPAMLHYYFGGKPELVEAFITERLQPALSGVRGSLIDAPLEDPPALAVAFVRAIMRVIEVNPWMPPLWVCEVLSEGGAFRDYLIRIVGPQLPQALAAHFTQAKAAGKLPAGIDPRLLVGSLIGLTMFQVASMPVWSRLFDAELTPAQIEAHAVALLQSALSVGEPK